MTRSDADPPLAPPLVPSSSSSSHDSHHRFDDDDRYTNVEMVITSSINQTNNKQKILEKNPKSNKNNIGGLEKEKEKTMTMTMILDENHQLRLKIKDLQEQIQWLLKQQQQQNMKEKKTTNSFPPNSVHNNDDNNNNEEEDEDEDECTTPTTMSSDESSLLSERKEIMEESTNEKQLEWKESPHHPSLPTSEENHSNEQKCTIESKDSNNNNNNSNKNADYEQQNMCLPHLKHKTAAPPPTTTTTPDKSNHPHQISYPKSVTSSHHHPGKLYHRKENKIFHHNPSSQSSSSPSSSDHVRLLANIDPYNDNNNDDDHDEEYGPYRHHHNNNNNNNEDQEFHFQTLLDRARWLAGLLVLQSCSSFILERNAQLIRNHLVVVNFLTMLVGAGGNAGNQASVRVIRGLAIGSFNSQTMKPILYTEFKMALCLSTILSISGFIRALIFQTPIAETIAITSSLYVIVFISIVLGCLLPVFMNWIGIDPAHSSTTIQVIMDILGVLITVFVSALILDTSIGPFITSFFQS